MEQIKLNYSFEALEPYIDTLTMETHYGKHHKAYTDAFNKLIEEHQEIQNKSEVEILANIEKLDPSYREAVRNNGGGYYNHNLYFDIMSPNPKKEPTGLLLEKINDQFGGVENLKTELIAAALTQFGSGWAWLVKDGSGKLSVVKTANQDTPLRLGLTPIIGIDVWEHAYYLKYKNLRKAYAEQFFEVLDWSKVEEYYSK